MNAKKKLRQGTESHLSYRRDIDGLRALAVLSVVIFHLFPTAMPGGFIGVDVFFVISGYLIGSILFRDLEDQNFSFVRFYRNRVRRIFPALLIVLAVVTTAAWFILYADELQNFAKHILAGATFLSNFVLLNESGYFDTATEAKPLLHLWSLGVEEQFYLLWPLVLAFLWRRKKTLLFGIGLLTAISFSLNLYFTDINTAFAFYSPITRFWEIFVGSILAYLELNKYTPPKKYESGLNLIGFALIACGLIFINKSSIFPGLFALFPVLGALLCLQAGAQGWINRVLLSNRLMVGIGLISYPLYLVHWPLLSFYRILIGGTPSILEKIIIALLSFVAAFAIYRLIENPIRRAKNNLATIYVLLSSLVFVGVIGFVIQNNQGFPERNIAVENQSLNQGLKWNFWDNYECNSRYQMSPCQTNGTTPEIVIMGDSHANHLYPGLISTRKEVVLAAGHCAPAEGIFIHVSKNSQEHPCATTDYVNKNLGIIAESHKVKFVLLTAFWKPVLLGELQNEADIEHWGTLSLVSKYPEEQLLSPKEMLVNGLIRTISKLEAENVKVIFMRDTPDISGDLKEYCHLGSRINTKNETCTISKKSYLLSRTPEAQLVEALLLHKPNLLVYDPIDNFCDAEVCYLQRGGVLLYRDHHHLSEEGSKILASGLNNILK